MTSEPKRFRKWLRGFSWRLAVVTLWPIYIPVFAVFLVVTWLCLLVAGFFRWLFTGNDDTLKAALD